LGAGKVIMESYFSRGISQQKPFNSYRAEGRDHFKGEPVNIGSQVGEERGKGGGRLNLRRIIV